VFNVVTNETVVCSL